MAVVDSTDLKVDEDKLVRHSLSNYDRKKLK